jgi:putative DNA primase/helicase
MAERLNVAIVLVSHFSKSGGTNGKHRVIGSIAYVGACRANLAFVKDRTDPTGRRVLVCDNGGNLAPAAPTLAYTIEDRGDGPCVEWLDAPVDITAEQALAAEAEAHLPDRNASERKEVESWLREVLSAGPVPSKEIETSARNNGIAIRTLKRAKESIGAESIREGFGKDSTCLWRLPDAPNH